MSRWRFAVLPVLLLTMQVAVAERPALPADAARVAAHIEACLHFAGEFNGNRSPRDREVTQHMAALKCERIGRDVERMRRRYPHDAAVQRAMDAASDL